MLKKVIIYHTDVGKNPSLDDLDTLQESEFVSKNLKELGYSPKSLPFALDMKRLETEIKRIKPKFIFNLVESVGGTDSLMYLAPLIFDEFKIPYTGCPTRAIFQTSDKLIAKEILQQNNVKTPKYISLGNHEKVNIRKGEKFLIKNAKEHASVGIDEKNLCLFEDKDEIIEALKEKIGEKYFAEQYIDGREFNISLVGNPVRILPIAEIRFNNYPEDKPKIIGYRAKWDTESYEYKNTIRNFDFWEDEKHLLKNLEKICMKCWKIFDLRGYARIDFRVDKNQIPYVLEINTNPGIAPDSGFIAAAEREGLTHSEIIEDIVRSIDMKPNY